MPPIARRNRVVAPDLPGFGASDKPVDVTYDFDLFEETLDELPRRARHRRGRARGARPRRPGRRALGACTGRERVTKLALLNTLVYPEFSEAVIGVHQGVQRARAARAADEPRRPRGRDGARPRGRGEPHRRGARRRARALRRRRLAAARSPPPGSACRLEGFAEIERMLPLAAGARARSSTASATASCPTSPQTMARVEADLPQAEVTALPDCGHFLQEEAPDRGSARSWRASSPTRRGLAADLLQVDVEDQRGVRRDVGREALRAVCEVRRG